MTAHKQDSIPSVGILLLQYILQYIPTHTHAYYAHRIITHIQHMPTITIRIYYI